MLIRFTKLDRERHALEIERGDSRERVELETRSTLHHDLTHFAVEQVAGIEEAFFGSLAGGSTLAELAGGARGETPVYSGVMMEVERIVARLQCLAKKDEDPVQLYGRILESFGCQKASPPAWFDVELVSAVRSRLRSLLGRWRATSPGGSMELRWPGEA